jgi:carbonic anhydrase/acetyltransferase-like protein (isoleucine patch superfamily)
MTFIINDTGAHNKIAISEETSRSLSGILTIRGDGNTVELSDGLRAQQVHIDVGSDCQIVIGRGCRLGAMSIYALRKGHIQIGSECGFNGRVRLLSHEPASLTIGNGCLFAGEVDVMTSDMHSIIEVDSGARINPARDIVIGDRVWVGHRVILLKGTIIGEGSIVAAGAVVSGEILPNSIAAGVPAKTIRSGVTWRHNLI